MTTRDVSQLQKAMDAFKNLPGKTAYILGSGIGGSVEPPRLEFSYNSRESLFCASSFKVFVLAAYLYYAERGELPNQPPLGNHPSLLDAALAESLSIETSDQNQGSKVFGELTGKTTASAILAAMISYSDNTATDIAMKRVGVENVRKFMYGTAQLNPAEVRIPDSTRAFADYLFPNPPTPDQRHLLNDVETMRCTPHAFYNFYAGAFTYFKAEETRRQFKWFLSMSEAIPLGIPEDMVCYMKGGMASYGGQEGQTDYVAEHAMVGAGQVVLWEKNPASGYPHELTVQFALFYSWDGNGEGIFRSGVQVFIECFKNVFDALQAYAAQG